MFIGQIADWAEQKHYLPAAIASAFGEVLARGDCATLADGRYDLTSVEGAFFLIQSFTAKAHEDTRAEAHRSFIDVQYVWSGDERYGFAPRQKDLAPTEELFAEKDIAFYPAPQNEFFFDLKAGQFAVFFPGEMHRPCGRVAAPAPIRKIVVKVPHNAVIGNE